MSKLSGPVSCYYLIGGGRKILMMGDEHFSTEGSCNDENAIDIRDYLDNIFANKGKTFDFYLEASYDSIEISRNSKISVMEQLQRYFQEATDQTYLIKVAEHYKKYYCFRREKTICAQHYPNVRFHNADFRFSTKCAPIKDLTEYFMFLIYMANNNIPINKNILGVFRKYLTFDKFMKKIYAGLLCKKMKKQFDKMSNKDSTHLKQYINQTLKSLENEHKLSYNNNMRKIINIIKNMKVVFSFPEFRYHLNIIANTVVTIEALIMDAYLLSRMFVKKEKNSEQPKNVIIYAGHAHISRYLDYLMEHKKYKLKGGGITDGYRCIDVSKLPRRLF
mgnify:CR=1 FL=1|jgi:hypothetical protein